MVVSPRPKVFPKAKTAQNRSPIDNEVGNARKMTFFSCCGGGSHSKQQNVDNSSAVAQRKKVAPVDISQRAKIVFLGDAGVGSNGSM